jgi:hypothetical protein
VNWHWLGRVLGEFAGGEPVRAKATVRLFPEARGKGQPAVAIDEDSQPRITGRWSRYGTGTEAVQIRAAVFRDGYQVVLATALRHIDEKSMSGLVGKEPEAKDFASG